MSVQPRRHFDLLYSSAIHVIVLLVGFVDVAPGEDELEMFS